MKPSSLPLEVAPRAILALGEELVRDERAALEELVKNSYDADATSVRVVFEVSKQQEALAICVIDNGTGMSFEDLRTKWLVVATSNKVSAFKSRAGRVMTGEKGIGRLATARLGRELEMATKRRDGVSLVLTVDWAQLETLEKLSDFRVHIREDEVRADELGVGRAGTSIRITGFRRLWRITPDGGDDFDEIELALARVINPFAKEAGVSLSLEARGAVEIHRVLEPPELLRKPHYRLIGKITGSGELIGKYENLPSSKAVDVRVPSKRFPQAIANDLCGPFSFDIRAWDREARVLEENAQLLGIKGTADDIRTALDRVNGFFVYRDNFLVVPKRMEDRDWLGLEARRVNLPSKHLGLSQIVAAVHVSRVGNPDLKDKSDREGLVDNVAARQLRNALDGILHVLETHRQLDKPPMGKARRLPQAEIQIARLDRAAKDLADGKLSAEDMRRIVRQEAKRLEEARQGLRVRLAALGRLAAVGQLAGVLVHEIGRGIPVLADSLNRLEEMSKEKLVVAARRAKDSVRSIQRVVQRFTPYFVGGIRTRRRVSELADVVSVAVETREKDIRERGIDVDVSVPAKLMVRVDPGDVLAVLSNLLDNAIFWSAHGGRKPAIRISGRGTNGTIRLRVSDSGPGIENDVLPRIFDPGFTLKRQGMGLGLAITKDIVDANEGTVAARGESRLGGALFEVVLPRADIE